MLRLKISLVNGDIFSTGCSTVFTKHIAGEMSRIEKTFDKRVHGWLTEFYRANEHRTDIKVRTSKKYPFEHLHIINFHDDDKPFTNLSVNTYARRLLNIALEDETAVRVATAIHGPSAGIDSSESLEIMLGALACELYTKNSIGNLAEIIFVQHNKEIFEGLQNRLKYLENDEGLIKSSGGEMFLESASKKFFTEFEEKLEHLSKPTFIIAMPFHEDFNDIYLYGIKKPISELGYKPERLDQESFSGDIVKRLKIRIPLSKMVVADITGNNPNVFYEVGFAHGINKQVVLITQDKELPFDLRNHRRILYQRGKIGQLETELKKLLDGILRQ